MIRNYIFNTQGVELFTIDNFLSSEECDNLCNQIANRNQPSTVTGAGLDPKVYSQNRTSKSAFLRDDDPMVHRVDQRISEEIEVPLSMSEPTQGQLYDVGEHFGDHTDYFEGDSYINSCLASGQRTWTVMIYLNDVEEGGHTEFSELGKSISPLKGRAVFWVGSHGRGAEIPATLHSGRPVIRGQKMIITKWFREREYKPLEDLRLAEEYWNRNAKEIRLLNGEHIKVKIDFVDGIAHARYGDHTNIPAMTQDGFVKAKIPEDLYAKIMTYYQAGRQDAFPEFDPQDKSEHLTSFIASDKSRYPTEMIPLNQEIKEEIFKGVGSVLQAWSQRELSPTYCYGIRTYKRGAVLKKHTDGFETRIISAILNVDQQVDEPWALQIDDHQGQEHEVFLKPGEMALYESAILSHGRVKPLKGDFYSNLFVHFVNLS